MVKHFLKITKTEFNCQYSGEENTYIITVSRGNRKFNFEMTCDKVPDDEEVVETLVWELKPYTEFCNENLLNPVDKDSLEIYKEFTRIHTNVQLIWTDDEISALLNNDLRLLFYSAYPVYLFTQYSEKIPSDEIWEEGVNLYEDFLSSRFDKGGNLYEEVEAFMSYRAIPKST